MLSETDVAPKAICGIGMGRKSPGGAMLVRSTFCANNDIDDSNTKAIVGGVCGFWGGVFSMGFIYLFMVKNPLSSVELASFQDRTHKVVQLYLILKHLHSVFHNECPKNVDKDFINPANKSTFI